MAFINGNSGNNLLKGTTDADDVYGLAGDDTLNPGARSDTVYLRDNPNSFYSTDEDFVDGGVGNDLLVLDYSTLPSNVGEYDIRIGDDDDDFSVAENSESEGYFGVEGYNSNQGIYDFFGGSFKNINQFQIIGNSGDDSIELLHTAGNNTITTNAGGDFIDLDYTSGNNVVNAGIDDNTILLQHSIGNNNVTADAGFDYISLDYATGKNIVNAGAGDNEIELQSTTGNNTVNAGTGIDYINLDYASGSNTITAGSGNDYLRLRNTSGSNTVNADAGDDDIDLRNATGNNIVTAGTGNDSLDGGFGNDNLNGGVGNDTMNGGAGNDGYVIDVISDTITEAAGAGTDTVLSSITYTLGNNLETLFLANVAGGINGNGNALNNKLVGNTAANQLSGGLGNDTLIGNAGNDVLTGGSGNDQFVFDSNKVFVSSEVGVDTISDFVHGTDKIVLDKTTFTTLTSIAGNGFNLASEFAVVGTDAAASTANALIVYSSETDNLFYNQNGVASGLGSGAQFATLSGISTMSAADFVIQV